MRFAQTTMDRASRDSTGASERATSPTFGGGARETVAEKVAKISLDCSGASARSSSKHGAWVIVTALSFGGEDIRPDAPLRGFPMREGLFGHLLSRGSEIALRRVMFQCAAIVRACVHAPPIADYPSPRRSPIGTIRPHTPTDAPPLPGRLSKTLSCSRRQASGLSERGVRI
jgi:hypothetical protein